jgi:hypothetical protein
MQIVVLLLSKLVDAMFSYTTQMCSNLTKTTSANLKQKKYEILTWCKKKRKKYKHETGRLD